MEANLLKKIGKVLMSTGPQRDWAIFYQHGGYIDPKGYTSKRNALQFMKLFNGKFIENMKTRRRIINKNYDENLSSPYLELKALSNNG